LNDATAESDFVLTTATAEAVLERAGHISASGMPLASGLRAAALETESFTLRRALRWIADQLDRGRSLEDCLAKSRRLPPHLAGLIIAARRTGAFGPMLAQWLENRRAARQQWRAVAAVLSYPVLAMTLATAIFLFFALMVVPTFKRMFDEFGLRLPAHTTMILWISEAGSIMLASVLVVGAAATVALRLIGGRTGWSLVITSLPIIGLPWHWTGVTEMLRGLGLLVENQVPLPEALDLTAAGIGDAYVGDQCRRLARRVEKGTSLTMALVHLRTLPLSIVPLVHWGERHGELAEALRSAAEMIEGRLTLRTDMLIQVIPPILFVFVGAMALSMVSGLFLPLISLIQGLS